MKLKPLFICGLLPILSCTTSVQAEETKTGKTTTTTSAPQKTEVEQWFDLAFVGEEIVEQKKEILLTTEKALQLFQADAPKFKPDWREKLGQEIEPEPKARKIPDGIIEQWAKDKNASRMTVIPAELNEVLVEIEAIRNRPFARLIGFSKSFAKIMILQPKGNYLWHHYEACLANFKVPRSEQLDKIFGLKELDPIYSFRVKGIGYGSTPSEVVKALGKPDGNEGFQKVGMCRYYYLKDDVTIDIDEGSVRLMTSGVSEWVKEEIKKNGPNVKRST